MQVFVRDRKGFLASRLVLGISEAGYIPGACYTLSTWYKKGELAKRVAVFFFGMFSGNALSPLLATGILKLDGARGLRGWQWLFIGTHKVHGDPRHVSLFGSNDLTLQSRDRLRWPSGLPFYSCSPAHLKSLLRCLVPASSASATLRRPFCRNGSRTMTRKSATGHKACTSHPSWCGGRSCTGAGGHTF